MLEFLCGSRSIEQILIFLLVNEQCYRTQLQQLLKIPSSSLKKALVHLEKAGVTTSYCVGKIRFYQLNPVYPLLTELERLLRKAYSLLPLKEKKEYCFVKKESWLKDQEIGFYQREDLEILSIFWKRLSAVRFLRFQSKSKSRVEIGWNGSGRGEVNVRYENERSLIFDEKGSWTQENGQEIDFNNTFRWVLDLEANMISLEHLRFGVNHPVFLFHLVVSSVNRLDSLDSHFCAEDVYLGKIDLSVNYLHLQWRIIGPIKDEEISYFYTETSIGD